ncbi:snRNA-activating protein complex subunit 3 [Geodia barretti]|uniref:snRNA-activating protein complex subunit 3 n=2 Tax=Geodia barretti TaxID=519541 RepID=A0AA35W3P4_GEOBA|nr:snRNA-activating protein complex subunit 3 [Geodia barretti]
MFVLGCQLLTEIRDKVTCFRDFIVDRDFSKDPDEFDHTPLMTGAAPNPSVSAFFFINNTFYNDCRHPSSVGLSSPIIEWSQQTDLDESPRLDRFHKADMATTRLDQLSLRLGYPYLFCHHNTCQHIVIFTDLRLLHPTESQLVSDYPKIFPINSGKRKLCQVCNLFSPRWVTLEDELAPESPCLFCSDCFKKLHYSAEGRKICRFKAYPYNPTMLF